VKGGVILYQNAIVVNDGGFAAPGRTGLGLPVLGRSVDQVDNSAGADGDLIASIERGCFTYDTAASGADEILATMSGQIAWLGDDHTLYATSGGGTRSPAGVIEVWAWLGFGPMPAQAGTLIAANNLEDVANARTARENIGANKTTLAVAVASLVAAGAAVTHFPAPVAGTISQVLASPQAALTTGGATLTLAINGVPVTNGVVNLPLAASAAGQVSTAAPTAANAVNQGDDISITVGGTNATATGALVTFEIDT
jgi:hypothetical protein